MKYDFLGVFMYYSDEEFAARVNERLGNIKFFKKCLRNLDLIGTRQKLSDDHFDLFKEVMEYRELNNATWEAAMNEILPKYSQDVEVPTEQIQLEILQEILTTLKRIEQKL